MVCASRRQLAIKFAVVLCTLGGAALLDARITSVHAAPWCAALGGRDGGWDCSYYSFEQCMATARGLGGFCVQNYYEAYQQPRRARRQYRY